MNKYFTYRWNRIPSIFHEYRQQHHHHHRCYKVLTHQLTTLCGKRYPIHSFILSSVRKSFIYATLRATFPIFLFNKFPSTFVCIYGVVYMYMSGSIATPLSCAKPKRTLLTRTDYHIRSVKVCNPLSIYYTRSGHVNPIILCILCVTNSGTQFIIWPCMGPFRIPKYRNSPPSRKRALHKFHFVYC